MAEKKWNLQDIRPAQKEAAESARPKPHEQHMQDIPPTRPSRPRPQEEEENVVTGLGTVDIIDAKKAKRKRLIISSVVAAVIILAGFIINALMGGAEVTVFPKFKDATVQATFTAYSTPQTDELSYELLTLEADGERQVSASGQEQVSERATGKILIYNAYSKSPQRLIKNTRFESPDGLIYRVEESVEVPGMSEGTDGKLAPGVITAEVFADGTGEQYNIGPAKFTIPGLEGTEQYDKMYAESTESFTGGFEGAKYIINDDELKTASQSLHVELRNALLARIEEERPAGFILFNNAITFTFDSLPATEYGDNLATIKERARLQVPVFKESEFAAYLAKNTIAGYEGEDITVVDPRALSFAYASATTATADIATMTELEFKLGGQARLLWVYDEEKLKNDLLGNSKTALPTILTGYPAIDRAKAVVRPFWTQSFPDNPEEIMITSVVGEESE